MVIALVLAIPALLCVVRVMLAGKTVDRATRMLTKLALIGALALLSCAWTAPPCQKSGLYVNREYVNAAQVCP
jgi:ABC-type dipeptide/oligopeptide/nickel transport system permease subunit